MLGERLRTFRQRKRLTQGELAKIIGVTRQTIAKWENNERVPDALMAKKLAKELRITADELLGKDENVTMPSKFAKEHYVFGKVKVGSKGEIKIPKEAQEVFQIKNGDEMIVLGDIERGIEFIPADMLWKMSLQKHEEYVEWEF